jgi:hypothetical protein
LNAWTPQVHQQDLLQVLVLVLVPVPVLAVLEQVLAVLEQVLAVLEQVLALVPGRVLGRVHVLMNQRHLNPTVLQVLVLVLVVLVVEHLEYEVLLQYPWYLLERYLLCQ